MNPTHSQHPKNENRTNPLQAFAANHPVVLVLTLTIVWLVLLFVFTGIASSLLRIPFGDVTSGSIGRLVVTGCVLVLLQYLGWLAASGISPLGNWQVWLIALASLIYISGASLYSFYGQVALDVSNLMQLPDSQIVILMQFLVGLSEEIMFRGLVLYALIRVWGNTARGRIGGVVLASLLFAALHITQVFTHGAPVLSALLLILQGLMISIWWGALVVLSGSIWPAVVFHFVLNAVVILQGLVVAMVRPDLLAYRLFLGFSIPLGVLGIGILLRARPRSILPEMP